MTNVDFRIVDMARPRREKIYVDGPEGIRVPFVQVALADSPVRSGAQPNAPVRLYDTSGPGAVPAVGLPALRAPWIGARGDVELYRGRPVNRRDDGRAAVR
jgi:phosphomethylpyrimidine synthase